MANVSASVLQNYSTLRQGGTHRDKRMADLRRVREGEIQSLWPDHFSDKFPKSVVANYVDTAASALARVIGPLPNLRCSSGAMKTFTDKARAQKKNRIGENFWRESSLEVQMTQTGADQYISYGFLPMWAEPDLDDKCPKIHLEDPTGCYFRLDRYYNVQQFAKVWRETLDSLAARFPDFYIPTNPRTGRPMDGTIETDCVLWIDATNVTIFLPEHSGQVLQSYTHKLDRAPVKIAVRPGLHNEPRGQFDDVLYVQLARAVIAQLALEAGQKAVQAPLVVPTDVVEYNEGPDAVIQTDNGAGVGKVRIQVPPEAFALSQQLDVEQKLGSQMSDTALGISPGSVVTGKGVQALLGTFDSQIDSAQTILGHALREITSIAFEIDETWFPNKTETINGSLSGESYEITYTPSKDIAGNYTCDVSYGFASGMSPQNALITMLQARGDGLIDRDTVRRQLPWGIDPEQVQRDLDVQEYEDGIKQGVLAALQSTGQMIAQGMIEPAMFFFQLANDMIDGRQSGKPMNQIMLASMQAFQAQQQAAQQQQQEAAAAQSSGASGPGGSGPNGEPLPGVQDSGLLYGVAPGQAGLSPGGRPSIQDLVAGMSGSGTAQLGASVRKRLPTG